MVGQIVSGSCLAWRTWLNAVDDVVGRLGFAWSTHGMGGVEGGNGCQRILASASAMSGAARNQPCDFPADGTNISQ
jgi:hypothetical protein